MRSRVDDEDAGFGHVDLASRGRYRGGGLRRVELKPTAKSCFQFLAVLIASVACRSPRLDQGEKSLYPGLTSTPTILDIAGDPSLQGTDVDIGGYGVTPLRSKSWTTVGEKTEFARKFQRRSIFKI